MRLGGAGNEASYKTCLTASVPSGGSKHPYLDRVPSGGSKHPYLDRVPSSYYCFGGQKTSAQITTKLQLPCCLKVFTHRRYTLTLS